MSLFKADGRLNVRMWIMSTQLFRVHLQFNDVLRQRKWLCVKNLYYYRQNRGLKCKMCRVYINIYAQGWAAKHYQCWLDESWFCNTQSNQWVASKASRHAFMAIGDQLCSNLTPVWHYFSLKAFADAFYCLRAYPLYSKSDFNDYEGAWFTATVMHCHEQLCISSLYFHSGGR